MATTDVESSLILLENATDGRDQDISHYGIDPDGDDRDDENGTEGPIFDRFYDEGGSVEIMKMTNFNPEKLGRIWRKLEPHMIEVYNDGRGRKSPVSRKDIC